MFQDHLFLINWLHFTIIYALKDTWDYCIYIVEALSTIASCASLPNSAYSDVHLVTWNQVNKDSGHSHFFLRGFWYVKKDERPKLL